MLPLSKASQSNSTGLSFSTPCIGTREALRGKSIGLVITTGSPRETFTREQAGFTIEESALPVIATIRYVQAQYIGLVALCNGHNLDPAEVAESRAAYQRLVLGK